VVIVIAIETDVDGLTCVGATAAVNVLRGSPEAPDGKSRHARAVTARRWRRLTMSSS
jgi:hypothetical protein